MADPRQIRAIIVDDEVHARELLAGLLADDKEITVVAQCKNGKSAIEAIQQFKSDIVFLDIQMPDFDGFEVLRRLPTKTLPHIVFVTAFDAYAIEAFEVNALDYLLKPFSKKRFARTMERAKAAIKTNEVHILTGRLVRLIQQNDFGKQLRVELDTSLKQQYLTEVTVSVANRFFNLSLQKVDLIESADHYIKLHSAGRTYLIHDSISSIETKLDPALFSRIHRTKIVRVKAIKEIQRTGDRAFHIVLVDGSRHRISRGQLEKLPRLVPPTP